MTYGTFAPSTDGSQYPDSAIVRRDFTIMAAHNVNTVRLYTPPRRDMLDDALECGLRLMVGVPWSQHVAFLDDPKLARDIRRETARTVCSLASHPAALLFAIGNEIPAAVVRWHGAARIERFLREMCDEIRQAAPEACLTYVNYPPTEHLDLDCFDVCAFNVYLHEQRSLQAYLAHLQHIAGNRPLLLAEAGADSLRQGEGGQASLTAMQIRTAFREGACGAVAFAWTDEWWRGGQMVTDWRFGLVDAERRAKPALAAVSREFACAPFPPEERAGWPRVSVVVCAYNAADTIDECLDSLARLDYPDYEVIVVNDGSRDATATLARAHAGVRVIDVSPNGGLSAARNVGLEHATGAIIAYTDADVRADSLWLTYLVQPFLTSAVVGSGGPNVVPADDPWIAQCVARAPGGPTHVLLDERIAEHVPGCNMAFRREALLAIGGFNPHFVRAGDDVDVCWRLQARGFKIGFSPAALVWHRHRSSVRAYWRQQVGYGEGELWLKPHHPDKFVGDHALWHGRIYSFLPFVRSLTRRRVNSGIWGTAAFPSVYQVGASPIAYLPHSILWQVASATLFLLGMAGLPTSFFRPALGALFLGLSGILMTAGKCIAYALQTDLERLPGIGSLSRPRSRRRYRRLIARLHFLQPVARVWGRVRGLFSPVGVEASPAQAPDDKTRRAGWIEARATLRLLFGCTQNRQFWGETWIGIETILHGVLQNLRAMRATRYLAVDDGWEHDRDISVGLNPWAAVDLRALIEEHAQGRVLLRTALKLRLTTPGWMLLIVTAALSVIVLTSGIVARSPLPFLAVSGIAAAGVSMALVRLMRTTIQIERAVARTVAMANMVEIRAAQTNARRVPKVLDWLSDLRSTIPLGLLLLSVLCGLAMMREGLPGVLGRSNAMLSLRPSQKPAPNALLSKTRTADASSLIPALPRISVSQGLPFGRTSTSGRTSRSAVTRILNTPRAR